MRSSSPSSLFSFPAYLTNSTRSPGLTSRGNALHGDAVPRWADIHGILRDRVFRTRSIGCGRSARLMRAAHSGPSACPVSGLPTLKARKRWIGSFPGVDVADALVCAKRRGRVSTRIHCMGADLVVWKPQVNQIDVLLHPTAASLAGLCPSDARDRRAPCSSWPGKRKLVAMDDCRPIASLRPHRRCAQRARSAGIGLRPCPGAIAKLERRPSRPKGS